ncbi:hypothetical protein [Sulfitobacter pontiacus]|nr:hypothetical protein [Sulfitobacter pontiacus]
MPNKLPPEAPDSAPRVARLILNRIGRALRFAQTPVTAAAVG